MDAVAEIELVEHAGNVGLDRQGRKDELFSDLGVGEAARDEAEDLPLAGGELVDPRATRSWPLGGGKYVISGYKITLTPRKGGQCTTKGKYTFKRSGKKLTFTVIKDKCADRRDILTHGAWTKIS